MVNGKSTAIVSGQRYIGYEQTLKEAGIEVVPDYVTNGNFEEEEAYRATTELLKKHPEVTGIFCASDVMAIGAIKAAEQLGRKVPEDLSVVGFDDIPVAKYVHGGITTISQSPYMMGKLGGEALVNMIETQTFIPHIELQYEFIVRSTTAACRTV